MSKVTIKSGGQLSRVKNSKGENKLEAITLSNDGRTINLHINDDSLSYLTIDEALNLRDALNQVIKQATGI